MKRISLARRNALFSSTHVSWGVFALIFVLAILFVRLIAPSFFWRAFAPVFRGADSLSAGMYAFSARFGDAAALTASNERLAKENAALASENRTLLQKVQDVSALYASSSPQSASSGILAGVLARPPESLYDTYVLDAGTNEGVTRGMEAFGAGGVPLGVVETVSSDFSRVVLFSAPGASVNGWVGSANVPVTLFGTGAGTFSVSLPRAEGISVGDIVSVPGPGALPIGSVARLDGDPSSPTVTLRIAPAADLFSVTWVRLRDVGASLSFSPLSTSTLP